MLAAVLMPLPHKVVGFYPAGGVAARLRQLLPPARAEMTVHAYWVAWPEYRAP